MVKSRPRSGRCSVGSLTRIWEFPTATIIIISVINRAIGRLRGVQTLGAPRVPHPLAARFRSSARLFPVTHIGQRKGAINRQAVRHSWHGATVWDAPDPHRFGDILQGLRT